MRSIYLFAGLFLIISMGLASASFISLFVAPSLDAARNSGMVQVISLLGTINFTQLDDVPSTYTGSANLCVVVNAGETGLIFTSCSNASSSGDITSVAGDGFITNGSTSGPVNLIFNSTKLNSTIVAVALANGFNMSAGASNIFNQNLNTSNNVTFENVTIVQNSAFLSNLTADWFKGKVVITTDGYFIYNGTTLFQDTTKLNSTIVAVALANGFNMSAGASNIFNQNLNTTNNVTFDNLTIIQNSNFQSNVSADWFKGLFNFVTDNYFSFNGSMLRQDTTKLNSTIVAVGLANGFNSSSGAANIFNQNLNTTNNVTFDNVTIIQNSAFLSNLTADWYKGKFLMTTDNYFTYNGTNLAQETTKLNATIVAVGLANGFNASGSGDITEVNGDAFITNGSTSGPVNLIFNETRMNNSIVSIGLANGFNTTTPLTNIFNQNLNTTNNVTFDNLTIIQNSAFLSNLTSDWFKGKFLMTTDNYFVYNGTNLAQETTKLNATIVAVGLANGFNSSSGAANIFNQNLNTTNNVTFDNLTIIQNSNFQSNVSADWFKGLFNFVTDNYFSFNGSMLRQDTTKLNATIDSRAASFNSTTYTNTNFLPFNSTGSNLDMNAKNITNVQHLQVQTINATANITVTERICFNPACTSYIYNNGTASIWA
ncbi:MAG: beta strand repeat-containing protein [Nitrososphaerales archaeon]